MDQHTERCLKDLRDELEQAIDCLQENEGERLEGLIESVARVLEEIHIALKESRKLARLRDARQPIDKQPSLDQGDPLARLLAGPE